MGLPAAKQMDQVLGTDIHIILMPPNSVPTAVPHPFSGYLTGDLSTNVNICGLPAATVGSTADNLPPHLPQGGPFQKPPTNKGTVMLGSNSVFINGKPAARNGDRVSTCNDPVDQMGAQVVASGTVYIGG